jgi:hypothetical protein
MGKEGLSSFPLRSSNARTVSRSWSGGPVEPGSEQESSHSSPRGASSQPTGVVPGGVIGRRREPTPPAPSPCFVSQGCTRTRWSSPRKSARLDPRAQYDTASWLSVVHHSPGGGNRVRVAFGGKRCGHGVGESRVERPAPGSGRGRTGPRPGGRRFPRDLRHHDTTPARPAPQVVDRAGAAGMTALCSG